LSKSAPQGHNEV